MQNTFRKRSLSCWRLTSGWAWLWRPDCWVGTAWRRRILYGFSKRASVCCWLAPPRAILSWSALTRERCDSVWRDTWVNSQPSLQTRRKIRSSRLEVVSTARLFIISEQKNLSCSQIPCCTCGRWPLTPRRSCFWPFLSRWPVPLPWWSPRETDSVWQETTQSSAPTL